MLPNHSLNPDNNIPSKLSPSWKTFLEQHNDYIDTKHTLAMQKNLLRIATTSSTAFEKLNEEEKRTYNLFHNTTIEGQEKRVDNDKITNLKNDIDKTKQTLAKANISLSEQSAEKLIGEFIKLNDQISRFINNPDKKNLFTYGKILDEYARILIALNVPVMDIYKAGMTFKADDDKSTTGSFGTNASAELISALVNKAITLMSLNNTKHNNQINLENGLRTLFNQRFTLNLTLQEPKTKPIDACIIYYNNATTKDAQIEKIKDQQLEKNIEATTVYFFSGKTLTKYQLNKENKSSEPYDLKKTAELRPPQAKIITDILPKHSIKGSSLTNLTTEDTRQIEGCFAPQKTKKMTPNYLEKTAELDPTKAKSITNIPSEKSIKNPMVNTIPSITPSITLSQGTARKPPTASSTSTTTKGTETIVTAATTPQSRKKLAEKIKDHASSNKSYLGYLLGIPTILFGGLLFAAGTVATVTGILAVPGVALLVAGGVLLTVGTGLVTQNATDNAKFDVATKNRSRAKSQTDTKENNAQQKNVYDRLPQKQKHKNVTQKQTDTTPVNSSNVTKNITGTTPVNSSRESRTENDRDNTGPGSTPTQKPT